MADADVREQRAMTDGDDVIGPDEDVRLAELEMARRPSFGRWWAL